jgi:hypothetical protein
MIYKKLIAILQEVDAIGKNKKNLGQGYMFRGIDDMYNAIHPLFSKNGVFITSEVLNSKREERQAAKGGNLIYTIVTCKFNFYAEDGRSVSSTLDGEAMDSGDKSTNKAMSAALKYALMQMFLIPTEEKLDTEYESPEVKSKGVKYEVKTDAIIDEESKPWLNKGTEQFDKAKTYLKEGGKIDQIRLKYKVSKEVEKLLTE